MFNKINYPSFRYAIIVILLMALSACDLLGPKSQIDARLDAQDLILLLDDLGRDFEAEDTDDLEDLLEDLLDDFTSDFEGKTDIEAFSYGISRQFEHVLGFTIEIKDPADWAVYDEKIADFEGDFIDEFLELADPDGDFDSDDFDLGFGDASAAYTIDYDHITADIFTFRRDRFAYIIAHIYVDKPDTDTDEIAETLDERLLALYGEDDPRLDENEDLEITTTTDLAWLFYSWRYGLTDEQPVVEEPAQPTEEPAPEEPVYPTEEPAVEEPVQPTEAPAVDTSSIPRYEIPIDAYDAVRGPADAEIVMIEFTDYECPFCQRYYTETFTQIMEVYGDQIFYVVKDLPLVSIHPNAAPAAIAAHCAGEQDSFWEFHALLFSMELGLNNSAYQSYAERLQLDLAAFNECIDSGRYEQTVLADTYILQEIGAPISTPTFFINGLYVAGAQPFAVFAEIIDAELATVQNDDSPAEEVGPEIGGQLQIAEVIGAGDLQSERVLLRHVGDEEISLIGWQLQDEDGHVFTFPALTMFSGGAVMVYSKAGTNSVVELYWGLTEAVWSEGEIVFLIDPNGNLQAVFEVP
jgi:protein-disulfide isomerase